MHVPAAIRWSSGGVFLALLAVALHSGDQFSLQREQMVRQMEGRGIRNPDVLRVMRTTPRHLFLPTNLQFRAYEDRPLPIGYDATISQPYIVALMTELLEPAKNHTVLEIGTGSGYQAAVLAQLVDHVYTIELVPELARSAEQTLRRLGYSNVTVRQGDGYRGWPEKAPFPLVILTASPPEIPQTLIDQLARGGRLVAPVGRVGIQELVLIEKNADGSLRRRDMGSVAFVPMVPGGR
jgi:protein-L-isoaspartate(D-aspartate) O-methyltransferase